MKIQKTVWMQAIAIGVLGTAMLLPARVAAQEISNTEWAGGPQTRLDQHSNAPVTEVAVANPANNAPVTAEAAVGVVAAPVSVASGLPKLNAVTQPWVISIVLFGLMLVGGLYRRLREFGRGGTTLRA